ncbi:hypothetical protein MTR_4g022940 [Medicago truncatula]|uniref:Rx N-terminal domain-containing protein n=1 Tax=Medicago truncatula TaxID=3880 RepID=G7JVR5_MEDTR|nr:hypothetical protein MTR_4g022940 [Medicago truncatula]
MAESLLFNMIEKLIGRLGSMGVECWNMRDDLDKMVDNMYEIKAVILDSSREPTTMKFNYGWKISKMLFMMPMTFSITSTRKT